MTPNYKVKYTISFKHLTSAVKENEVSSNSYEIAKIEQELRRQCGIEKRYKVEILECNNCGYVN